MSYPAYQYPSYQQPIQIPQMQMQPQMQMPIYQPSQNPIQQVSGINGKIVDSIEVVKATDIPMDGNSHYFPKADGTEIYIKKWLPNGSTEVKTFRAVEDIPVEEEPKIDFNAFENNIVDRLESIEDRIEKLQKGLNNQRQNNNRKEQS